MKNMVAGDGEEPETIHPLRNNEMLMVNVATSTSVGIVKGVEKNKAIRCVSQFAQTKDNEYRSHAVLVRMASYWSRNHSMR